jgi:hypothetical protein
MGKVMVCMGREPVTRSLVRSLADECVRPVELPLACRLG